METPLIIWEPSPLFCMPENLQECLNAARVVDIFSPNHIEIAQVFGEKLTISIKDDMEKLAAKIVTSGVGQDGTGAVIIRAGENGCLVTARGISPVWLPPFYEPTAVQSGKVVDPTGAGNAFLGAYAVGYATTRNVIYAACYGTIGASFALEQVGMPKKSDAENVELWNGIEVQSRLTEYMTRQGIAEILKGQCRGQ